MTCWHPTRKTIRPGEVDSGICQNRSNRWVYTVLNSAPHGCAVLTMGLNDISGPICIRPRMILEQRYNFALRRAETVSTEHIMVFASATLARCDRNTSGTHEIDIGICPLEILYPVNIVMVRNKDFDGWRIGLMCERIET